MAAINQLSSVNLRDLIRNANPGQSVQNEAKTKDFGDTIVDFVKSVDQKAKDASGKAADVIQGRSDNLHEAMTALEESGLSFKLMVEIRNKLLESYKEVERMSV
ncbi:MAG: flagellar hook-basal body complex protein FliE [Calditrichaeota bacterium]|nr:MAG: flagellar hook-basal body complex protein FliE [Calditrichota bacterium]